MGSCFLPKARTFCNDFFPLPILSEALYITCKLQNCTEANKGKPFPGYIDPNSLVVQDEYVFVQVSNKRR